MKNLISNNPLMKAVIAIGEEELLTTHVETIEEAREWGRKTIKRLICKVGHKEAERLGYTHAELVVWSDKE